MTTEEIIHVYENSRLVTDNFTEEAVTAAYVEGLAALHTQQEQENPKPLKLDELREMDGEPVWIERHDSNSSEDKEWALVFAEGGFCRTSVGNIAFLALYGQTWLAYRHKPKEG